MAQDRRPPAPKAKPKATEGHVVCETVADALAFLERTEYWACPFCGDVADDEDALSAHVERMHAERAVLILSQALAEFHEGWG
jgi:hypothetical protein